MLHEVDTAGYRCGPKVPVLIFRQVVDRIRQVNLINKIKRTVSIPVEDLDTTSCRTGQIDALVQAAVY